MTRRTLHDEFMGEMATTRRFLERLPPERLEWRPHAKSFTVAGLAGHLMDCVGWLDAILGHEVFDVDPKTYRPYHVTSLPVLLAAFDECVDRGDGLLSRLGDADLDAVWRLTVRGKVRVERPKGDAVRDFVLSHVIHHRGQLSLYLRLLDVPVPGAYGPTADDAA